MSRSRLARTRTIGIGWNDARADRLEHVGFIRREVFDRLTPRGCGWGSGGWLRLLLDLARNGRGHGDRQRRAREARALQQVTSRYTLRVVLHAAQLKSPGPQKAQKNTSTDYADFTDSKRSSRPRASRLQRAAPPVGDRRQTCATEHGRKTATRFAAVFLPGSVAHVVAAFGRHGSLVSV